jgi:hypothetical protein
MSKYLSKFLIKKVFEKYCIPYEIQIIVIKQLMALRIQSIYRLNRPPQILGLGDRVYIRSFLCNFNNLPQHCYKIKYGTIIKVTENHCKVQLLPKPIPLWRKSNMNFWNNYNVSNENSINTFSHFNNNTSPIKITFPYFMPLPITVLNKSIVKLHKWKSNPYSIVKPIKNTVIKSYNN